MSEVEFKWSIIGSMSQCLQGLNVEPNDIDIILDQAYVDTANKIWDRYMVKRIQFIQNEKIRSYYGVIQIDEVKVDVFAGVENEVQEGMWRNHKDWEKNIVYVSIQSLRVPVLSLHYEYSICVQLERWERADQILTLLRLKGQNPNVKNTYNKDFYDRP